MEIQKNWEDFWKSWRSKKIENDDDLYFQVGRTTNQKPSPKEIFDFQNQDIRNALSLNQDDVLVDLCCGNGLCTYEFRDQVKQIIAVDFAPGMIDAARQFKSASNITYCLGGVIEFLAHFNKNHDVHATKFSMNGGLPYFTPDELKTILGLIKIISGGEFISIFTIVPNELLKWNYYNTEERKQKYLKNIATGNFINDGIGRWWHPDEIEEICTALGLECVVNNQPPFISNFRMDIVIRSKKAF